MKERQIAKAFADFMEGKGLRASGLSLSSFLPVFLEYFAEVKFDGLSKEDGDMLLFQYGTYDWGRGRFFEVDFTRQYYLDFPVTNAHEILQQRFTFYFDPQNFSEISSFNIWSRDCDDLHNFQDAVVTSAGYLAAVSRESLKFEVTVEDVC